MGGTASVAKSQAQPKATGSAAKYEDKTPIAESGSKAESRVEPVPPKAEDAQTIASEPAEPKIASSKEKALPDTTDTKAESKIESKIDSRSSSPRKNSKLASPRKDSRVSSPRVPSRGTSPRNTDIIGSGFVADESSQPPLRNDNSASQIALFTVGDFVKVKLEDGSYSEGILVEIVDEEMVAVNFTVEDMVKNVRADDCELVVHSDVMEVGDQVQVQPQGSAMYFVGRVSQVNTDGTYDVVMEGDDPDDIERSVPESNIRKLMSRRALAVARWKRAALVVSSINNFQSFALDPGNFNPSSRVAKISQKLPGLLEMSQALSQQSV